MSNVSEIKGHKAGIGSDLSDKRGLVGPAPEGGRRKEQGDTGEDEFGSPPGKAAWGRRVAGGLQGIRTCISSPFVNGVILRHAYLPTSPANLPHTMFGSLSANPSSLKCTGGSNHRF